MKTIGGMVHVPLTHQKCGNGILFDSANSIFLDRSRDEWVVKGWCKECNEEVDFILDDEEKINLEQLWLGTQGIKRNAEGRVLE